MTLREGASITDNWPRQPVAGALPRCRTHRLLLRQQGRTDRHGGSAVVAGDRRPAPLPRIRHATAHQKPYGGDATNCERRPYSVESRLRVLRTWRCEVTGA